jgi:site-specific DNA-methyltransferase (adenine-specific)
MKKLEDKSIDMVLTDPPYGTTACKWDTVIPFEPMWKELKRICKGVILLFGSEPFSSHLRLNNLKDFRYDWYWYKNSPSGIALAKYQPMRSIESISVFSTMKNSYYPQLMESKITDRIIGRSNGKVGQKRKIDKSVHGMSLAIKSNNPENIIRKMCTPRNVLEFKVVSRAKGTFHPTQKPVALLEYLIKTYTLEGETVLDFTMGSGSTGVACKNLNRKFIGIEKEEKYFEIAKQRIGL